MATRSTIEDFFFTQEVPTYTEHKRWFQEKVNNPNTIFEKLLCENVPCGILKLGYSQVHDSWILNWYIIPKFQGRGIGTIALNFAKKLVTKKPIYAFVFKENVASNKAMNKAGFKVIVEGNDGFWYVSLPNEA